MSESIDKQILNNIKTHYSGLIKEEATNIGADMFSKSVFSKIDTDGSNELSASEISSANMDTIIINSYNELPGAWEKDNIQTIFEANYTRGLANVDANSDLSVSEQIINNNIKEVVQQILEYAENHPENEQL